MEEAINNAFYDYYKTTGRKPTRIYVGREEYVELRNSHCAYVTVSMPVGETKDGDINYAQMEVMGMQVFEVCENRHFYVC